jgi:hypothetical protein
VPARQAKPRGDLFSSRDFGIKKQLVRANQIRRRRRPHRMQAQEKRIQDGPRCFVVMERVGLL